MEPEPIEQVVRNIDQRLTKVEQILPTLATKAEMRDAIAEAVAPLATKEEIAKLATKEEIAKLATKEEIAKLATKEEVAKLATKEEMVNAIAAASAETRRHFDVVAEGIEHQIKLLAEGIAGVREQHERRFEKIEKDMVGLDRRVMTLEAERRRRTR